MVMRYGDALGRCSMATFRCYVFMTDTTRWRCFAMALFDGDAFAMVVLYGGGLWHLFAMEMFCGDALLRCFAMAILCDGDA